jgi:spore maturation protein CgeB
MLVPAELLRDLADRSGALLYCYHPDNPLSPHRSHSNKNTHALIPIADCYFTFLRHMLPSLKQAGARRVEYLPFAYDPDLRHPADLLDAERQQLHCPLAFVGNYAPDRAEWFQHVLDFGLALWGSGWDAAYSLDARFRQAVKGPPQYGESFCKIYSSCDIGLNIIRALQGGDGHNMRTFEAMACGGLVMSNRTTELVDLFLENEEMVCFSNPQEMREKVIHYLDHPGDRARIASAGYARVKGETYSRRAQQILQVLVQQTEKPDWVTGGSRGENGERR